METQSENIAKVAIVGCGVAAWMSAAYLAHMLGGAVEVLVVELPNCELAHFNDATLPPLKAFHATLGIGETELLSTCQGSMKLGTQFVNWGQLGNRYFHPHGSFGAEFDAVPLHQWWLREQSEAADGSSLDQLSLASALAQCGSFAHPVPDRRMIQSTYDYAYHLDAILYAAMLRARALKAGVSVICASDVSANVNAQSGLVVSVTTDDSTVVQADFFLDCSGSRGALINEALGVSWQDWSDYLPCDRAVTVSCVRGQDFPPFSKSTAREAGWQWRIPLQHETRCGYAYAAQFCSDDDALALLMENLDGRASCEPKYHMFKNGRRTNSFVGNVVAIGDASGFLEPMEATSLQMIQSGITRLLALWPTRAFEPVLAAEYNAITTAEWDLARDFLILHYHLNGRADTPFWRACKNIPLPDSLAHRLAHWHAGARLVSPRPEVFQSPSWLSVLVGQSALPAHGDPLAQARAAQVDYVARLSGLRNIISETAASLPSHREWIDKNARGRRT